LLTFVGGERKQREFERRKENRGTDRVQASSNNDTENRVCYAFVTR
jgi:hypothetical protein